MTGMKYCAGYLLLHMGGKESPSAADVEKLLTDSGIEVDKKILKLVIDRMEGKSVHELIEAGQKKLAVMGGGGGGGGGGGAAAAGGGGGGGDAPAEKKAVVEEEEEEEGM